MYGKSILLESMT